MFLSQSLSINIWLQNLWLGLNRDNIFEWSDTGPALSKLNKLLPIGPRAGDSYSRLCAQTIVSERVLNRDNMFEWIDISICTDCCFRELSLRKSSSSWINDSVLIRHNYQHVIKSNLFSPNLIKIGCVLYLVEKLFVGAKQQTLNHSRGR